MSHAMICPWWLAYTFDHPLRRLVHRPRTLYGAYVCEGMTVCDLGCGLGFNTMGLAELVGPNGRVIAVDGDQVTVAWEQGIQTTQHVTALI